MFLKNIILFVLALTNSANGAVGTVPVSCAAEARYQLYGPTHRCCLKEKSGSDKCYQVGASVQMQANFPQLKSSESNYKDNTLDGPFKEWHLGTKKLRVQGNYKQGQPEGEWIVYSPDSKKEYRFLYEQQKLKFFSSRENGKENKTIVNAKSVDPSSSRPIGVLHPAPASANYLHNFGYDSEKSMDHLILYGDEAGKTFAGLAVADYRFTPNGIGKSSCDLSDGSDPGIFWNVFRKIGNKCLVEIGDPECTDRTIGNFWVACENYQDTADYYKNAVLSIDVKGEFYDQAGGKKIKVLPIKVVQGEFTTGVKMLATKNVKNTLWVQIEFNDICNGESNYQGTYWVKFWEGNKTRLTRIGRC